VSDAPTSESPALWRARELLGAVAIPAWAGFHLWEQWSAFGGRAVFVDRMTSTSHGPLALAAELLLGIAPVVAWLAIEARLLRAPEPAALKVAMADSPALALRLGWIARVGSWVLFFFVLVHAVWIFAPKLIDGSEPLIAWLRLRDELGTWPLATVHAVGLTALAVHVWGAVPRAAILLGWGETPQARRAARLSGGIVGVALLILYAQLAGWHAAGTGTIWPI